ncbi:mitochondrial oxaloacetate carrier protein [Spathaspora passalidarum NRRL Y-27907]|uniref:Mitochondrial thiamine pyrophosphate carrier 1 n=1 Tax=Spathaspora passalidarum (strain NRRL Y-27907 / 11-Y1) TaxID=619300 RepID=G3ARC8_SPAPN|nr:mitochondrial oxaloacetate carrier protein [Spathaspora passalidarum NRRL Y-27907]EGW31735.1 mitochondrial oxaloacetate carrier protein [Spathaspora passalidarum NRRL Y-27907]
MNQAEKESILVTAAGQAKAMTIPKRKKTAQEKVSTFGGFLAGGLAACGAVTFTNPIELIKTRMQLQGELSKTSANAVRLYKNPFQAFLVIYKNEGIRGLQQGLMCGYYYQLGLNGCRIGLYEPSRKFLTQYLTPSKYVENGIIPQNLSINVLAGFISGSAGAVLASPFFLIKTRMQSYTKASNLQGATVGQQTYYKGAWDGIAKIYTSEGFKGLYRGVDAAILRTGAGSAAQLPVYNLTKNFLLKHDIVADHSIGLHFISSSMAGLGVAIVMNPWDVILTRMYNQKGNLYTGPLDCFRKTISIEGPAALYKGFWAQLFRIGPHSILTLMFMEQCMKAMVSIEQRLGY